MSKPVAEYKEVKTQSKIFTSNQKQLCMSLYIVPPKMHERTWIIEVRASRTAGPSDAVIISEESGVQNHSAAVNALCYECTS